MRQLNSLSAGSVLLLLAELVLLTSVVLSQLNHAFDYGASCKVNYECDETKFIYCNMRTLRCDCAEGLLRNVEDGKCLRKEGWSCSSKRGPTCTKNASCILGRCVCSDDFLPNGDGTCLLTYGMPCNGASQNCSWLQYLVCPKVSPLSHEQRKCECIKEGLNFTWDITKEKCVALVGSECDLDLQINTNGIECVRNSYCHPNGICECKDGYSETASKTCLLKYGEKCNNSLGEFCNKYDFLNCIDGECNCEFFNQMSYDEKIGKCRLVSGEPCGWPINGSDGKGNLPTDSTQFKRSGLDDRIHSCVEGAVCVARNDHGRGQCACVDGKREAKNKSCEEIPFREESETSFGTLETSCTENSVDPRCVTNKPSKRLICTDESGTRICTCGEGAIFNGTDCLNLPEENCVGPLRSNQCVPNSYCDSVQGICKCVEHFRLETETSSCRPSYDSKTNPEFSSLPENEYYPSNNNNSGKDDGSCSTLNYRLDRMKCYCEMLGPLVTWSNEGRLCVGLVGAPCKINQDKFNFLCIQNATCDLEEETCQCQEGYYHSKMDVCLQDDGMGEDYINYSDDEVQFQTQHPVSSNSKRPSSFIPFFILYYYSIFTTLLTFVQSI